MGSEYSIKEIAKIMGLGVHTLRYYEKIGLIKPVSRNSSGYRIYTEKDIPWLRFITRLRTTGMPVSEMLELAAMYDRGKSTMTERRLLLEKHRKRVEEDIKICKATLKLLIKRLNIIELKKRSLQKKILLFKLEF